MTIASSRSSYSKVACPLALRNSLLPPVTANTTSSASIRPTPCASISAPSRSSAKVAVTLHSRRASWLGPAELVVVHTPSKRPSSVSSDSSYKGPEKVYTSPMEGPSSPRSSSCSSSRVATTVKVSWPPAAVSTNMDNPTRTAIDPMRSALLGTVLPFLGCRFVRRKEVNMPLKNIACAFAIYCSEPWDGQNQSHRHHNRLCRKH